MSQTIFGFCNEYIDIEKSDDRIILDLGYYDSEDEVITQVVNNTEWECPKFNTEGKKDMQVPIRTNPKNTGRKFR